MHLRPLRITLAFAFLITLYFAYVMLFTPPILLEIYGVSSLDPMHRYLSMVGGSILIVIAIGAALAFLQPLRFASSVTLLIIYHFARFIVDLILIAQGDIPWNILIPEMVYFLLMCAALIRFFPVKQEEKQESAEAEPLKEPEENPSADEPPAK